MESANPTARILVGDALDRLSEIPDKSVRCVVTSPPYFRLRSYNHPDQIGLEPTPREYVTALVRVFAELRRVLTDDGTLWVNLGDTSSRSGTGARNSTRWPKQSRNDHLPTTPTRIGPLKNLLGIPWMVAFALQEDGWILRSDIVWQKPNTMPESVSDRPTRSHEYVFLLSKKQRYFYDADAIKEPAIDGDHSRNVVEAFDTSDGFLPPQKGLRARSSKHPIGGMKHSGDDAHRTYSGNAYSPNGWRNKRDVWSISTQPTSINHFAVMPEALAEPCILAGSAPGDTVLDPFAGAGTTGLVALRHGRNFVGIELNPAYAEDAATRIRFRGDLAMATRGDPKMFDDAPMLAQCEVVPPRRDSISALGA